MSAVMLTIEIKLFLTLFPSSPPGKRESLYLTEGGREAFDQLYRLWEGQMRVVSTSTPSPLLPPPQDSQTQLVSDLLNVLIGVASTSFPLNQVGFFIMYYQCFTCSGMQRVLFVLCFCLFVSYLSDSGVSVWMKT